MVLGRRFAGPNLQPRNTWRLTAPASRARVRRRPPGRQAEPRPGATRATTADRRGCRRPENGRADGVRPHDASAIRAPQPSRQRARRQRREPNVTEKGQLEPGPAHWAVAPSTPPQTPAPSSTRTLLMSPPSAVHVRFPRALFKAGITLIRQARLVCRSSVRDHAASSRMRAYSADWPSKPMPGRSDSVRYPPSNLASSAKPPNAPNTPG